MRVDLPFGREKLPVEVPDASTVLLPSAVEALSEPSAAVRDSLRRPIAGPPLAARVRPGQTVAIVISDVTRPVPNELLLTPLIEALLTAGVNEHDITLVNGTGLHRPDTPEELQWMLGAEIASRYRIVQHEARAPATLVEVGRSKGVPVEFCRAYVEADVRIVTGFVEPHLFAGYSGGAKGVMPGVAGHAIVMSNHGAANLAHPRATWLCAAGNPVFDEIQSAVDLCPPAFLLNVTLDGERRLTGVFAGDLAPTHAAARGQADRQYKAPVSHPYDVVVVTNMGYPADTTLYQSVKGMTVAAEAVRDAGAILLVAGCEQGIGGPEYVSFLREGASPADLLATICRSEHTRHDQWQIQCQAMVQAKATVYLHSHLSRADTESAHLAYVEDPSATVRRLVAEAQSAGRDGSVLVLPYGQLTVPVIV